MTRAVPHRRGHTEHSLEPPRGCPRRFDWRLVRDSPLASPRIGSACAAPAQEKLNKGNAAGAVAALGDTDGVRDNDATGEDRIVGVPSTAHDQMDSNLHALIPKAMPETTPVAIPGYDLHPAALMGTGTIRGVKQMRMK
jgi:hypothetical protein